MQQRVWSGMPNINLLTFVSVISLATGLCSCVGSFGNDVPPSTPLGASAAGTGSTTGDGTTTAQVTTGGGGASTGHGTTSSGGTGTTTGGRETTTGGTTTTGHTTTTGGTTTGHASTTGGAATTTGGAMNVPPAVLREHYDANRTGVNLQETILTTANVNSNSFGKVFSLAVDADVFAQPLYVPGLTMMQDGLVHNVVFIATMKNTLYAFDADHGGTALWTINFGSPSQSGILSTPVIDPVAGRIYAVSNTAGQYQLHAVILTTGKEAVASVTFQGSVQGSAPEAQNGVVNFEAGQQLQRPALLLYQGLLFIGFGSHSDQLPYHGWMFANDATTLANRGLYNTCPDSAGGAFWQSGAGFATDDTGIYAMSANGFNQNPANASDRSESFLRLVPQNDTIVEDDYFTPSNWNSLDDQDLDIGTMGPLLIPGTHIAIGGAKQGEVYVLDTTNLGGLNGTDHIIQEFSATSGQIYASPVFYNNKLYVWGTGDVGRAYTWNGKTFDTTPVQTTAQSTNTGGFPGGSLIISANGTTAGSAILWVYVPLSGDAHSSPAAGILRAFDANNLGTQLWTSQQNAGRDSYGNFTKLSTPIEVNGKVYAPTRSGAVVVYGLLP